MINSVDSLATYNSTNTAKLESKENADIKTEMFSSQTLEDLDIDGNEPVIENETLEQCPAKEEKPSFLNKLLGIGAGAQVGGFAGRTIGGFFGPLGMVVGHWAGTFLGGAVGHEHADKL